METMGIGAGLGALAFWGFIATVVVAGIWYGVREREAQHETLRRLVESGQPLEPNLTDTLLGTNKRLDRNLKAAGLILLSAAPGVAIFGWILSLLYTSVLFPLLAVAALVACVSVGLLVASRAIEQSYRESQSSAKTPPLE